MNDTFLHIRVSQELYDKLKAIAAKKNISVSSLVRMICSEYLDA